jgi:RNA polymerase sigma factor (TIGR02999 family)
MHRQAAPPGDQVSTLMASADQGDRSAGDALFAALYSELHRLAQRELARRGGGVTIGATTLLHEVYLEIAGRAASVAFPDRARFMGYAARVMRGLIIDYARRRRALKRGGGFEVSALDVEEAEAADPRALSDISDALDSLAQVDPPLSEIVDLRFFCGFSFAEIAALQGVSARTVQRHWEKARIFLHRALGAAPSSHARRERA